MLCGVGEFLTKLGEGTLIREHVWVVVPETAGGKGAPGRLCAKGPFFTVHISRDEKEEIRRTNRARLVG